MRVRKTHNSIRTFVAFIPLLAVGSCTFQLGPEESGHSMPDVPPTTITVKAVNQTDKPLDPEIYVGPLADGLDSLITAANKRTDFGLGGVGILTKDTSEASFSVACGEGVFIATQGGIYGDDLTAPAGQGQQYVLEEDLNVRCGAMVVFRYSLNGSQLVTSFAVEPRND